MSNLSDQAIQHLVDLGLQEISSGWSKEVWDQDFVELPCGWPSEVPDEAAALEVSLSGLLGVCRAWKVDGESSGMICDQPPAA